MSSRLFKRLFCAVAVAGLASAVARANVVESTYSGPDGGDYETPGNWTPATVPNNTAGTQYDITFPADSEVATLSSNSVTVNNLTFGSDAFGGFSGGIYVKGGGALNVTGDTTFQGSYNGSYAGVICQSSTTGSASVSLGTLTNFDPTTNTLSNVVLYSLVDGGGAATVKFANANVVTLDHSYIALGAGGVITDGSGNNAFRNLASLTDGAFFNVAIMTFFTGADFSVSSDSTLSIQEADFKISGSFNNFNNATSTLTGGQYDLQGSSGFTAILQFNGDVVTNAASIEYLNNYCEILDFGGHNALGSFSVNAPTGNFSVSDGANFTTGGDFTNNGQIGVTTGDSMGNATFTVSGSLTNYDPGTGALTGGYYNIESDTTGSATFRFANTGIISNAAYIYMYGPQSQFTDMSGNNALRTLTTNTSAGVLTLSDLTLNVPSMANAGAINLFGPATLSSAGAMTNTGNVSLLEANLNADSYTQSAGTTDLFMSDLHVNKTISIQGGILSGGGTLEGAVSVTGGMLSPGETDEDTDIFAVTGSLSLSGSAHSVFYISGTTRGAGSGFDPITFQETGGYDAIDVTNTLALGGELDLTLYGGFTPDPGDEYVIMTSSGLSGAFANVADGSTILTTDGGGYFTVYYGPTSPYDPNDVILASFSAVPEPGMGAFVVAAMGMRVRRRRSA